MPELDRLITAAVESVSSDGPERQQKIADNLADFMGDDNASMMGGWT